MAKTPAGPPPDQAALRQAALRHLARYAATEAGLLAVLRRRVERWARASDGAGEQVAAAMANAATVVASLVEAGAVNDAQFAEMRTRSLRRAGRSARAITAHLRAKGLDAADAAVAEDDAAEFTAALLYAAKRRLGPFRSAPAEGASRAGDAARLARAGFAAPTAYRVLDLQPDQADELLLHARRP